MKNYKSRVIRRWWVWAVSTVITLAVVLVLGYAIVKMVMDSPMINQAMFLYVIGGAGICITFFLGQAVQSILVKSWDTYLGDLGPTQMAILIEELKKCKIKIEKEEENET